MNLESGQLLWIRVLESTDRRAIRRYWVTCLLQSEIDQVVGELRLAGRAVTHEDVGRRVLRRSGPYSFARGALDYVVPATQDHVSTVETAIGYISNNHKSGNPCMGIRLEKKGITVIGGWIESAMLQSEQKAKEERVAKIQILPKGLMYICV
jgi:hypothetical protein